MVRLKGLLLLILLILDFLHIWHAHGLETAKVVSVLHNRPAVYSLHTQVWMHAVAIHGVFCSNAQIFYAMCKV